MRIGNHILDHKYVFLFIILLLTACPYNNECEYRTSVFGYLSQEKINDVHYYLSLNVNSKPVYFVLDSSMDITKYGDTLIFKSFKMNLNAGDSIVVSLQSRDQRMAECRDVIYGETTTSCIFWLSPKGNKRDSIKIEKSYDSFCIQNH